MLTRWRSSGEEGLEQAAERGHLPPHVIGVGRCTRQEEGPFERHEQVVGEGVYVEVVPRLRAAGQSGDEQFGEAVAPGDDRRQDGLGRPLMWGSPR